MKSGNLYSAFLYEFGKIRDTEREVVSFLPQLVEAIADPQLTQVLVRQREEAQCLLSALANIKLGKKNAAQNTEIQSLLSEGEPIIKIKKRGPEQDRAISAFAEKIIAYEIEGCGCLVAMAKKLGFEEEADVLNKGLRKKEALEKKDKYDDAPVGGRSRYSETRLHQQKQGHVRQTVIHMSGTFFRNVLWLRVTTNKGELL